MFSNDPEKTPPSSFGSSMGFDLEEALNFGTYDTETNLRRLKLKTPSRLPSGGITKDTPRQFKDYAEYAHHIHEICNRRPDSRLLLATYVPCNPLKAQYPYNFTDCTDILSKPPTLKFEHNNDVLSQQDEPSSFLNSTGLLDFSDTDMDLPSSYNYSVPKSRYQDDLKNPAQAVTQKPTCKVYAPSPQSIPVARSLISHLSTDHYPQIPLADSFLRITSTPSKNISVTGSINSINDPLNTFQVDNSLSGLPMSHKNKAPSSKNVPLLQNRKYFVDKRCDRCFSSKTRCKYTNGSTCDTCEFMGLDCVYSRSRNGCSLKKSDQDCMKHIIRVVQHTLKWVDQGTKRGQK